MPKLGLLFVMVVLLTVVSVGHGAPTAGGGPAAMAIPAPPAGPPSTPYRVLDRGTCSSPAGWDGSYRDVPWVITDDYWYTTFWSGTHPRPRTALDPGCGTSSPPPIDFQREMLVVLRGRPGSAEIRTRAMGMRDSLLVATYDNPAVPEIAIPGDRVPFEALVLPRSGVGIRSVESAESQSLNRLIALLPSLRRFPGGGRRHLREETLAQTRANLQAEGRVFLEELSRAEVGADNPLTPLVRLLEGRALESALGDRRAAARVYQDVVTGFPGTPAARLARHRLSSLRRFDLELAARTQLDRMRAERVQAGGPPSARAWLMLGGQYEYLNTQFPEAVFAALDCYRRGSIDPNDHDGAQNCLLRAGDAAALYLDRPTAARWYAECIRRYPDALSVPVVLKRMKTIFEEYGDPRAATVYGDFLRRYPRSPRVEDVRGLMR